MKVNSVEELCKFLISCAFQRCRMLDYPCRLSVSLKPTPPLVRISVSDTGAGSTLEEFQEVNYQNNPILAGKWDGVLCIATTSISEKEIHHLNFNLKEVGSSTRLVRLPSATKNGATFSGTEVSFSIHEEIDALVTMISIYIQKMLFLKAPKIAVELSVESGVSMVSQSKSIVLQNVCDALPMHAANIDCLKMGFVEYVSKHGNRLAEACHYCFSDGNNVKVGTGIAVSRGNQRRRGVVMEVVLICSETPRPDQSSCSRLYGTRTEVLYFRDFSPCSISQSSLDALTSMDWKKFGLILKSVNDQDGVTLLEWEKLPPYAHIDIVLHRYHKEVMIQPPQNSRIDRSLTRKAVKLALNELKEKNAGVLLSDRAAKICRYAPDLAKTISGLILSSHDMNFQGECLSLLGLQFQEISRDIVDKCIKDKIISVVETNDRNSLASKEAPPLFVDDDDEAYDEPYDSDEQYD